MNKYNYNFKINKNRKKANLILNNETKFLLIRSLINDKQVNKSLIYFIKNNGIKFDKYNLNKINNMCLKTSNSRGLQTFFKQNRISVKKNFGNNLISGLRKSSW